MNHSQLKETCLPAFDILFIFDSHLFHSINNT